MVAHRDPFGFDGLKYIRRVEDSKALNDRHDPMVIISASAMCEVGRVLHHLKNNIESSRNTVLFGGFQAEHTLGRRILNGEETVPILGKRHRLNARVESIDGYSAHADRNEILRYMSRLDPGRIKRAFWVHGGEPAARSVAEGLQELGVQEAVIPSLGQRASL